jgi:vacuolar-type H+-ATPase subunit F/Vma7
MKMLIIGHPEAISGFSLVGVHGQVATNGEQAKQALEQALMTTDIGIILITQDVSGLIKDRINQLNQRGTAPLVVEIPGPEGVRPDQPTLGEVIRRAIGEKI